MIWGTYYVLHIQKELRAKFFLDMQYVMEITT
jgi:hypothetical protein